ncbi:hypothetical protein ACLOJK_018634 [Asimina triloba]
MTSTPQHQPCASLQQYAIVNLAHFYGIKDIETFDETTREREWRLQNGFSGAAITGCVERDGMRQRGRAVLRGMGRRGRGRWGDDGNEEDKDENPRETVVMGDRGRISPISGGMGDGREEDEVCGRELLMRDRERERVSFPVRAADREEVGSFRRLLSSHRWDERRMRMGGMETVEYDGSSCDFFEEDENERDGNNRARWELLRFFGSNRKNPNAYSHAPFDVSDGSRWNGWSDEVTAPDFLCSPTA